MSSDFFTGPLKIIFQISSLEHVLHDFIIDSGFQENMFVLF